MLSNFTGEVSWMNEETGRRCLKSLLMVHMSSRLISLDHSFGYRLQA